MTTTYRLPIEIEHALPSSPVRDYRKESLFVLNAAGHLVNLTDTPTKVALSVNLEGEDYGLKVSNNVHAHPRRAA